MKRIALSTAGNQSNVELFQKSNGGYLIQWGSAINQTTDKETALRIFSGWAGLAIMKVLNNDE